MRVALYQPNCETVAWHNPCTVCVLDKEITEAQYRIILAMFDMKLEESPHITIDDIKTVIKTINEDEIHGI